MSATTGQYRLLTRSDFDGLVCAALLREIGLINDVQFCHPKDMQDGQVTVTDRDIITNLPYVPGCHLTFDHHSSEAKRLGTLPANLVLDPDAPSAARVVFKHYGGAARFPTFGEDLMTAVDRADSAQWTQDEVMDTKGGWPLLSFIMDSRTGLGRFRDFAISNYQLMVKMIDLIRTKDLAGILADPDVAERLALYREQAAKFTEQVKRCAKQTGDVVVLDLRGEDVIYAGNRFMIYALFPSAKVSIHAMWGRDKQNVVFACGKSIFDRSSSADIGALMLKHGGGGHKAAGTCQIDATRAAAILEELVSALQG